MMMTIMKNGYSKRMIDVIEAGREEASRLQNSYICPEHLLLGLLRKGDGNAIRILQELQVDLQQIKRNIELEIRNTDDEASPGNIAVSKNAERVLRISMLEARMFKSDRTRTEHLLLALLKEEYNTAAQVLNQSGINYRTVYEHISALTGVDRLGEVTHDGFTDDEEEDDVPFAPFRRNPGQQPTPQPTPPPASTGTTAQKTPTDTPVLDNFSTDMTKAAAEGKLDPVVGREREIERLAQILSRRKKNNPVLIGEPGVGKSAIVEGLAQRIVQHKVSRVLFDKRVVNLDLASLVAGTKYRGQFEERIKALLNELTRNPHIILFIDEIHTLVGAGSAAGSMDAANMLKPALARGELQCIGATTLDEYRTNIEKDGALERRFQKVIVDPTTAEETLQILKNIKGRYEEHHNMIYTDAALEACVKLTDRYISDRNFPDKAIDALDEAGSRVHITHVVVPRHIEELEAMIEETKRAKLAAVKSQNFELAAGYRDTERQYLQQLDEAKSQWEREMQEHRETVDADQVAEVVAMMSGVPVQRIATTESLKLRDMDTLLKQKIIGQDEAVGKIVRAIRRNRVGLKDPNKPIGTFMFLGPTGVGKTHLAKKLAEFLFDSADALIRIDMSEYLEKFAVSRLIGAPPGYVGYEEGGQLTEKVRRKPYSVILLDEIEKAHPDVFNLLLQVLDEGRLTDSLGRQINFKNTILIMTSNIGSRQLKDFGRGIGFHPQAATTEADRDHSRGVIRKALERSFAPEFLNRVDDVIMFDPLEKESIYRIIDIELSDLYRRIDALGYHFELTPEAKEYVTTKGYDAQFGARPLKRAIQRYVEDELAEIILLDNIQPGDTITLGYDAATDRMTHTVSRLAPAETPAAAE